MNDPLQDPHATDGTGLPARERLLLDYLLGELPEERWDEVDRLLRDRPDLARFHAEIALLLPLLREAARPHVEDVPAADRLDVARRQALLEELRKPQASAASHGTQPAVATHAPERKRVAWYANVSWWAGSLAACMVLVMLTGLVAPMFLKVRKESPEKAERNRISLLENEVEMYKLKFGDLASDQDVRGGVPDSSGSTMSWATPSAPSSAPATLPALPVDLPTTGDLPVVGKLHGADALESVASTGRPAREMSVDGKVRRGVARDDAYAYDKVGRIGGGENLKRLDDGRVSSRGNVDADGDVPGWTDAPGEKKNLGYEGATSLSGPRQEVAGKPAEPEFAQDANEQLRLEKAVGEKKKDVSNRLQPPVAPLPEAPRETSCADDPFSTFSLHVGDASFRLAAAAARELRLPEPATVRAEEFVNAFDLGDPAPRGTARFTFRDELAAHPIAPGRTLLRVSAQAAASGRHSQTPLDLVVALDTSGSMERPDRRRTVCAALEALALKLGAADTISVVGFSRTSRLIVDRASGPAAIEALRNLAANIPPAEGGTDLDGALRMAYAKLAAQGRRGAVSRVVLLTDGAANLGDADPERLAALVSANRKAGRALDCFGVGLQGEGDAMLERLSRDGDGRYAALDSADEAGSDFAERLAGALRPAASDVKVQIEFNPQRVASWRLVGYEKHTLTREQFRDDTVDAAELAAAESGTAVYVLELRPDGIGDVGMAHVRYRDTASGQIREEARILGFSPPPAFAAAPAGIRIAGTAAMLAELLARPTEFDPDAPSAIRAQADSLAMQNPSDARLAELRVISLLAEERLSGGK